MARIATQGPVVEKHPPVTARVIHLKRATLIQENASAVVVQLVTSVLPRFLFALGTHSKKQRRSAVLLLCFQGHSLVVFDYRHRHLNRGARVASASSGAAANFPCTVPREGPAFTA